jgi:zinc/manganese transport system permease protein
MTAGLVEAAALRSAAAGALALAFGGAPLGVLLVARRMSLSGDAMSHAILPGVALGYLLAPDHPFALTAGALIAAFLVAGVASLLSRLKTIPEDAAFAVVYLPAFALGILLIGRQADPEAVHALLFGSASAFDRQALILAASAATATLVSLALFVRGFLGEGADPVFMRSAGAPSWALHLIFMMLVAFNLVAGFRAFGAMMTVALMMIPAASARFWSRGYIGQASAAVLISALASGAGLLIATALKIEPGAVMTLSAAVLFAVSAVVGPRGGLLQSLPGRPHLEG